MRDRVLIFEELSDNGNDIEVYQTADGYEIFEDEEITNRIIISTDLNNAWHETSIALCGRIKSFRDDTKSRHIRFPFYEDLALADLRTGCEFGSSNPCFVVFEKGRFDSISNWNSDVRWFRYFEKDGVWHSRVVGIFETERDLFSQLVISVFRKTSPIEDPSAFHTAYWHGVL